MLQEFVRGLSEKSRYYRFASSLRELSVPVLVKYTLIDYDLEMALVAVQTLRTPGADGGFVEAERILGVSRYIANPDDSSGEFSLVVDDRFSGQGLGTRLMLAIMDVARDKGLKELNGLVLVKNSGMLKLMASWGSRSGLTRRISTSGCVRRHCEVAECGVERRLTPRSGPWQR